MTQITSFPGPSLIPQTMHAMRIHESGDINAEFTGLVSEVIEVPKPAPLEVLIHIQYCGVCHTELDEIEARAAPAHLPITPGHQVVGVVVAQGRGCELGLMGKAVGVAWIHSSCGHCHYCRSGRENLCADFQACGKDHDGGYAEYMTAPEAFVHPIPAAIPLLQAAPLLCAGAVGYRSLLMANLQAESSLGLTGFGSSGRLVLQMAKALHPRIPVHVFARSALERQIALQLGADWVGDTEDEAPQRLSAIIDTTPAWQPVLAALRQLAPGGRLVINAIRKQADDRHLLAGLDYSSQLWLEKSVQSVANVTRADVRNMLQLAATHEFRITVDEYSLQQAGQALRAIKSGNIQAAAVLKIG